MLAVRIASALPSLEARLRQRAIATVAARVEALSDGSDPSDATLLGVLSRVAEEALGAYGEVKKRATALSLRVQSAHTDPERQEVLAAYLRDPRGRSTREIRGDVAATKRWLDLEAVLDRIGSEAADRLDEAEVAYTALGGVARSLADPRATLVAAGVAKVIRAVLSSAEPARPDPVRTRALQAVRAVLEQLAPSDRLATLGADKLARVIAWARGASASRWVQIAALELHAAVASDAVDLLVERLRDRTPKDGMIVRRNALRLLGILEFDEEARVGAALVARDDPSEHVRQELCRFLGSTPSEGALDALEMLATEDDSPRVRGVALREITARCLKTPEEGPRTQSVVARALVGANAPLAHRIAFESIERLTDGASPPCDRAVFVGPLDALVRRDATPADIVLGAAVLLRTLEVRSAPLLEDARVRIERELSTLGEGESRKIELPEGLAEKDVERAALVAAKGDMTVGLRPLGGRNWRLIHGEPRGLRLWRLAHEMRTPTPDKRKSFTHTEARVPAGEIVVPPDGMAEVTPTRVPGERRLNAAIGGWGQFLPRIDDLLAASRPFARRLRLATSLGTVVLRGPDDVLGRLRAWWLLTMRYAAYALERERSLEAAEPEEQKRFSEIVSRLGFEMSLAETEGDVEGEAFSVRGSFATRYLSLAVPLTSPLWLEDLVVKFLSPEGSTAWHLAIVGWAIFSVTVLRAAWILSSIERSRRSIPLTIGGWGTRGKSGSERLKAALFHALRYDVVVKTTGCEAMYIHARRDAPAREVFLYRPYDKATIWEQRDVLRLGSRVGAQVFLWECMALQPRFVDLLSQEWMQDDVMTLTNAYPDHEDVMGPSGEDVARVIGRFMPKKGIVFTAEEQMLPLLRDAARQKQARFEVATPNEADLLPQDLLARFPYAEHPRNIAMVLAVAVHLGIDREYSLVEMADRVIPDLGVLKTYPTVRHVGRELSFSNGMSANERAGFMSNWLRLGFDKHDLEKEPRKVTVTVVNNRGDRVPRSRVFADIMVRDIAVDHVVCIGTNLGGLYQFMQESLEVHVGGLTVGTKKDDPNEALRRADAALERLKVRRDPDALRAAVREMLVGLGVAQDEATKIVSGPEMDAALDQGESLGEALDKTGFQIPGDDGSLRKDVLEHAARFGRQSWRIRDARTAIEKAASAGTFAEADEILRRAYRETFLEKVTIVERSDSTGDQVVDRVARVIPPGYFARVMGCQNIKGTGLDFVYRWTSVDRVWGVLARMEAEPAERRELLAWLSSYADFGLVDCREALAHVRSKLESTDPAWTEHLALLEAVASRLAELEKKKSVALVATQTRSLVERILDKIEPFVDHLDSIRRRNKAERAIQDVYDTRIGQGMAELVFRELVGRGKGGWLAKDYVKWRAKRVAAKAALSPKTT